MKVLDLLTKLYEKEFGKFTAPKAVVVAAKEKPAP